MKLLCIFFVLVLLALLVVLIKRACIQVINNAKSIVRIQDMSLKIRSIFTLLKNAAFLYIVSCAPFVVIILAIDLVPDWQIEFTDAYWVYGGLVVSMLAICQSILRLNAHERNS